MLELKPTNKMYWLGLIAAHYLVGDHANCMRLVDAYDAIQVQDSASLAASPAATATARFETSELLSFRARVLAESGGCRLVFSRA
jgi:hypothetical protein